MLKGNAFSLVVVTAVLAFASFAMSEDDDRFPPQPPAANPIKSPFVQPLMTGKEVWAMLNPPPRGEFEEKADYEKRLLKIDPSAILYVDVTPPHYGSVIYDIDRHVLKVGFLATKPNMIKTLKGHSIRIEDDIEMKTATGQNGFGATRDIITLSGNSYEAYVANINDFFKFGPNPNYSLPAIAGNDFASLEFPLDVATAKAVKPTVRIILGLSLLGKDKQETSEFNNPATETNRIESNTKTFAIGATIRKVIVFDPVSDKVIFSR